MRLVLIGVFTAMMAAAQQNALARIEPAPTRSFDNKLWFTSAVAVAAAAALDTHSSYGKCCEANPLLSSPDGRFGGRATMIKTGALGAQLLIQRLTVNKSPTLRRIFTYVNFGTAAALTAVAVHNYGVPQPKAGIRLR